MALQFDITCGCIPHRKYVCILALIGLTICYVMRFCISIAITEMVHVTGEKHDPDGCPKPEDQGSKGNDTKPSNKMEWTEMQQGIALSAFFWGYMLTQVPGGLITDRIGARYVITASTTLTCLGTFATPEISKHLGIGGFIGVRVFLGLAQGLFYASLHTLVSSWVPPEERGFWASLVFTGAHLGNAMQNIFSGLMLNAFRPSWEWVFYVWGTCGMVWTVLFFLTTYDKYTQVASITEKEKAIMDAYYEKVNKKVKVKKTPWKAIMRSMPVWAMIIAMVGHDWGLFALVTDIPKYMKSVLYFNVKQNGLLVGSAYVLLCVLVFVTGYVADVIDKKKLMSKTWNRKVFYTISSVGPSLGLLATSWSACRREMAVAFLIVGIALMSTFYPSLKVNIIDVAPNHAGVIGALVHTVGAISGAVVPWFIGLMTPDSTWSQWNIVWWVTFGVMTITNIIYVIFGSADLQPWNTEGTEDDAKK